MCVFVYVCVCVRACVYCCCNYNNVCVCVGWCVFRVILWRAFWNITLCNPYIYNNYRAVYGVIYIERCVPAYQLIRCSNT